MDSVERFCPYCGRSVEPGDIPTCMSCGKAVYLDRDTLRNITDRSEEPRLSKVVDCLDDGNYEKAMAISNELAAEYPGSPGVMFLRGAVYAYHGEDGKALADWKVGMENIQDLSNVDAYLTAAVRSLTEMLCYQEEHFIDIDRVKCIDRVSSGFDKYTGNSVRGLIYMEIFLALSDRMTQREAEGLDTYDDIVREMFERAMVYCRDYRILPSFIDAYLCTLDYNEDTYEEDDMYAGHILYSIARVMELYLVNLTDDQLLDIMDQWDDDGMAVLDEMYRNLKNFGKGDGVVHKILKRVNTSEEEASAIESEGELEGAVDIYVRRCLRLDIVATDGSTQMQP